MPHHCAGGSLHCLGSIRRGSPAGLSGQQATARSEGVLEQGPEPRAAQQAQRGAGCAGVRQAVQEKRTSATQPHVRGRAHHGRRLALRLVESVLLGSPVLSYLRQAWVANLSAQLIPSRRREAYTRQVVRGRSKPQDHATCKCAVLNTNACHIRPATRQAPCQATPQGSHARPLPAAARQ